MKDLIIQLMKSTKSIKMKKLFLLFLFIGLLSCDNKKEFTQELLLGQWDVRYNENYGDEIIARYCKGQLKSGCVAIIFDADGTFTQRIGDKRRGKWQVEGGGENKQIVLIYEDGNRIKSDLKNFEYVNDNYFKGGLKISISAYNEHEELVIPIYTN